MLTQDDLFEVGNVISGALRREVLPRLDVLERGIGEILPRIEAVERGIGEIKLAAQSAEFRMGDTQDDLSLIAKAVNRIERRLDASGIPEAPDGGSWR